MFFAYLYALSISLSLKQSKVHYPRGAVLTVIDGFGESAWPEGNAIQNSEMPFLNYLKSHYPYQSLVAAQQPVGLISKEPGSSAVGHQTLGLGRTTPSYYQIMERSLNRNSSISMINNQVLRNGLRNAKRAHFVGLCTNEGIFSHPKFLPPMFEAAIIENVSEVYVHCILTTLIDKPSKYLKDIEDLFPKTINEYKTHFSPKNKDKIHVNTKFKIAAVYSGETAMNKMRNWTATQVAYDAMVDSNKITKLPKSKALRFLDSLHQVVPIFNPICMYDDKKGSEKDCEKSIMYENDPVIYFHYREDKSYQLAKALIEGLPQSKKNPQLHVLLLILYHPSLLNKAKTILPAIKYPNSIGSWISKKGFKQLRVSEKYKKSHATTFFSGGVLQPLFDGEDRHVDFESVSETIADLHPEMNSTLITKAAIDGIKKKKQNTNINTTAASNNYYKFIFVNFPNVDATGHTGNESAVRIACRVVDKKIKEIYDACVENDFALFITSDHGNGEEMIKLDGQPQLFHTVNNVPFIAVYSTDWEKNKKALKEKDSEYEFEISGSKNSFKIGNVPFIGNVAPSILYALGIEIPPEMEPSIINRKILTKELQVKNNNDDEINYNNQAPILRQDQSLILPVNKQNILILIGFILGIISSILTMFMFRFMRIGNCISMNNDRRDSWVHSFSGVQHNIL